LADNIRPILQALCAREPVDEAMRTRAQSEYQRLRNLFDQSRTFDHPLLRRLRPHIDKAQARGVDVSVHVDGVLPALIPADAEQLAAPLSHSLAATASAARITFSGSITGIEASIVCRGLRHGHAWTYDNAQASAQLEFTTMADTTWVTIRHTTTGSRTIESIR
jgi:hypothetical protein